MSYLLSLAALLGQTSVSCHCFHGLVCACISQLSSPALSQFLSSALFTSDTSLSVSTLTSEDSPLMVCVANFWSHVIYYVQFWLCKAQFKQSVLLICMKIVVDHVMKHHLCNFPIFFMITSSTSLSSSSISFLFFAIFVFIFIFRKSVYLVQKTFESCQVKYSNQNKFCCFFSLCSLPSLQKCQLEL